MSLTLLIYAGTIYVVTLQLRQKIRTQMVARDAEVLQAVAQMESTASTDGALSLAEPAEQLALLLRISRLKGVVAARLYDPHGTFVTSFPAGTSEGQLTGADKQTLRDLRSHSRFYEQARLAALFSVPPPAVQTPNGQAPLLEILLPLHEAGKNGLLGIAQFFIDAQALSAKFRQLDRDLLWQSLAAFAVGGLIIVFGLGGTLFRLQRKHLDLVAMTDRLARANLELTMAAKTTAVGAVAAHLIHGLKNPLHGLHNLIASGSLAETRPGERGWQTAQNATRDLLAMIEASAGLLRQESEVYLNETRLSEVISRLGAKLQSDFSAKRVRLSQALAADATLSGRHAALTALILENLLRNALQAAPSGGEVCLAVTGVSGEVMVTVRDNGPGFPEEKRPLLFLPCQSSKPGGLGIGLAISKQLANHLGARLDLLEESQPGCTFVLAFTAAPLPPPASGDSPRILLATLSVVS